MCVCAGAQSDSELTVGSTQASSEAGERGYNSDGELYAHDPAAAAAKHADKTSPGSQTVEAKPLPASHGSWMLVRSHAE